MSYREWACVVLSAALVSGAVYVMLVAVLALDVAGVGVYGG